MTEFEQGDKVKWKSHGGEAVGHVERKITSGTEAGGRKSGAEAKLPQLRIRSPRHLPPLFSQFPWFALRPYIQRAVLLKNELGMRLVVKTNFDSQVPRLVLSHFYAPVPVHRFLLAS